MNRLCHLPMSVEQRFSTEKMNIFFGNNGYKSDSAFLKKLTGGCLVFLLSLGLIVSALEIGARFLPPGFVTFADERTRFCELDPLLGWINQPNRHGRMVSSDFDIRVDINPKGFRDADSAYVKPDKGYRILALGDSFVWGYGVNRDERFTEILENSLPETEIINMGCSGYGQDQELLLLAKKGLRYQPDLVMVHVHFPSDSWNNSVSIAYGYFKPVFVVEKKCLVLKNVPIPKTFPGVLLDRWLTQHSAFWNRIKYRTNNGKPLYYYFNRVFTSLSSARSPGMILDDYPAEMKTWALLEQMRKLCISHDVDFLVTIAPEIYLDQVLPSGTYKRFIGIMSQSEISYIELGSLFEDFLDQNHGQVITFEHDRHWNCLGHAEMASFLEAYFQETGWGPFGGGSP